MKRLLFAVLFLPSLGWASYQPVTGSTFTVNPLLVGGAVVSTSNPLPTHDTGTVLMQGGLSDNGAAAGTNRAGTLPGVAQTTYRNGTALTQGRDASLSVGTDGITWAANPGMMMPPTFTWSTGTFTVANTTADVVGICGNSTKLLGIKLIRVSGTMTTAGVTPISIIRRSTAYTGPISTITVVGDFYTAPYKVSISSAWLTNVNGITNGTAISQISNMMVGINATTGTNSDIYQSPGIWRDHPIWLNGTADCLGINFLGYTLTGLKLSVDINGEEITTISP